MSTYLNFYSDFLKLMEKLLVYDLKEKKMLGELGADGTQELNLEDSSSKSLHI